MPPHYPVLAGEIKKEGYRQKYRIRKSNKRRESKVEDKAHHAKLERVRIQRMGIKESE